MIIVSSQYIYTYSFGNDKIVPGFSSTRSREQLKTMKCGIQLVDLFHFVWIYFCNFFPSELFPAQLLKNAIQFKVLLLRSWIWRYCGSQVALLMIEFSFDFVQLPVSTGI